jgi:hypothetical protein
MRPRVALEFGVRLTTDPPQIAFGGSHDCRFSIGENVGLPPAAIHLLEWERFNSLDDAADRRRSERNKIWITSHKADVTPVLHDGNDVACEQGAFAPAIAGRRWPMQYGAAFEMTAEID